MPLKPQDVLVVMKWALHPGERWTFPGLASALGISASEAHAAVKRALQSRLLCRVGEGPAAVQPMRENLVEFLVHGLKYCFPAERGGTTRGVPTAHAVPALAQHFGGGTGLPPVWPDPKGTVRGEGFKPLYGSAARAAANDPELYAALALIDAIRGGHAREREIAARLLTGMVMGAGR